MSWLNNYLSRSYLGLSIPGVSTMALIKARTKHAFGYCQIVVGFTKSPQGSYMPLAKCWMCGTESPDDRPTAAEIMKYMDTFEKLSGEQKNPGTTSD